MFNAKTVNQVTSLFLEGYGKLLTNKFDKVKNRVQVPILILRILKCIDGQEVATISIFKSNFVPGGKNINN